MCVLSGYLLRVESHLRIKYRVQFLPPSIRTHTGFKVGLDCAQSRASSCSQHISAAIQKLSQRHPDLAGSKIHGWGLVLITSTGNILYILLPWNFSAMANESITPDAFYSEVAPVAYDGENTVCATAAWW